MYWAIECNREMHPFFYRYPLCVWGGVFGFGSDSGSKSNCAARVGSDDLGHGPVWATHQGRSAPADAVGRVRAGAAVSADLPSGCTLAPMLRRIQTQHAFGKGPV